MQTFLNILPTTLAARCRGLHHYTVLLASALLLLLGAAPARAGAGFNADVIYLNGVSQEGTLTQGALNSTYYTNNAGPSGANRQFDGAFLGTFDRNTARTNSLNINARSYTTANGGDNIITTQMFYRVYRVDGASEPGNPVPLNLEFEAGNPGGDAQWRNLGNGLDLLSFGTTTNPGDYYLEVFFRGRARIANSTDTLTFFDDNGTQRYKARFTITVNNQSFRSSTWTSTSDRDWFNGFNWSNGMPDSNTDVTIQIKPSGVNGVYPDITDNGTGRIAQARNITLVGRRGAMVTLLSTAGNTRLTIFGNLQDVNNGFRQNGGVLTLGGQNQTFDSSPTLNNLVISGGGTKTLTRPISIVNSLTFDGPNAGILAANNDDPLQGVTLQPTATLTGEDEGAYIAGLVKTTRTVSQGMQETFGNLGLDLTANSSDVGAVTLIRTNYIYYGVGTSVSVQRGFLLQANTTNQDNFDLTFHYLNDNLNGIEPGDLRLFRSETGDLPFQGLALTSTGNKTLTRKGISGLLAATFTLGDVNNPLPVELVSFTATGTAQGAALKWITASEVNNKGFGIERQVAGATTWQSVGYVAATNQANGSSYSYLDKTLPASATQVYYRLRQEDADGSLHYSPVAAISRAAQGTDLTLSPVPLQGGPLAVSFAEAGQAGTEIVVLNMQGQRVARYTTAASTDGAVSLPLDNLAAGVYSVSVQVPGQATRHARFVKQ